MSETPKKSRYKVRDHFVVHFDDGRDPVEGGEIVELTEDEAERFTVQVEPVGKPKKAADGAGD